MALSVPDELLPVIVPTAVYWIASGIYTIMMGSMEKHRLYTPEEEDANNLVTRRQVVVGVLLNHAIQMAAVALTFLATGGKGDEATESPAPPTSLPRLAGQLAVAILFVDAWQYFWHRWTHENKFVYKHVHSMHHRLVAPYAYAAQYLHPVDSFFGDIVSGAAASLLTGMSPRTSAFFFAVLTIKTIDDHCGLWFPGNPMNRLLTNNSAFHAFHHHRQGSKHNFSNYFLATWDKLLGTSLPFTVEAREGGGYQLRAAAKDTEDNE